MNAQLRRLVTSVPILRETYYKARSLYHERRTVRAGRAVFQNVKDYQRAVMVERPGKRLDLYTKDGLRFTVRQNKKDAGILAEIFLDQDYTRGLRLRENPIVVDVGGYIGDFSIYAAKYLKARTVITIEPSAQNFELLEANIRNNNYQDRIYPLCKAVTDGRWVKMNIDTEEAGQMRVSAHYGSGHGELKDVPGISIAQIVKDYSLPAIDLLKIDCEGGEYLILLTVPIEVLYATQHTINLTLPFPCLKNHSRLRGCVVIQASINRRTRKRSDPSAVREVPVFLWRSRWRPSHLPRKRNERRSG